MKKTETMMAIRWVAPLFLVIIGLTGCASHSVNESTYSVTQAADGTYQVSENFFVNNLKLARGIRVSDQSSKFAGDLLMVQVTLVSLYDDTQDYKYKFSWCDADGFEIDSGSSSWLPLTMYGSQTKQIKGVAPNPSVKQFKLMLRTD